MFERFLDFFFPNKGVVLPFQTREWLGNLGEVFVGEVFNTSPVIANETEECSHVA